MKPLPHQWQANVTINLGPQQAACVMAGKGNRVSVVAWVDGLVFCGWCDRPWTVERAKESFCPQRDGGTAPDNTELTE